jgi:hypothetical protein
MLYDEALIEPLGVISLLNRRMHRWMSLTLVTATALPWSLSLGVMGVWLIAQDHQGILAGRWVSVSAGIASLCAAQIVFLICIADRLFPQTNRVLSRAVEGGLGAIFLGSAGVLAIASIAGWGMS